jgi:antitoxin MazE
MDGKLVVAPFAESAYDLHKLLAGVTDENLHGELGWGPAVGREAW